MAKTSGRKGRPWRRCVAEVKRRSQICWICGDAIDMDLTFPHPESFSVDHLIPLSQLDEDDPRRTDPDYCAPAHLSCNSSRQAKSVLEVRSSSEHEPLRTSRDWL